jgi:hypothetical protein
MAYTAYDDVLDNEPHAAEKIPMANTALRASCSLYIEEFISASSEALRPSLTRTVHQVFTEVDAANAWELQHCRAAVEQDYIILPNKLPRFGNRSVLARRSFAHVLAPLLLFQTEYGTDSMQYKRLRTGLQHFLIARQLQDDLHDWVEDLQAGQITWSITNLLQLAGINSGRHQTDELIWQLRRVFWERGLKEQCAVIVDHTQKARKSLLQVGLSSNTADSFMHLVRRLEDSAIQAEQNYMLDRDFVQYYQQ